jgi:RNase P subunit RPR2
MIKSKDKVSFKADFDFLVKESQVLYDLNRELSDRYAYIAYKIYLSKKLKLAKNEKVLICRKCNKILIPGKTLVIRLSKGMITYKCLNCANVRRLRYDSGI